MRNNDKNRSMHLLPWISPHETESAYQNNVRKLTHEFNDACQNLQDPNEDLGAKKAALNLAMFWQKRMRLVINLLLGNWTQHVENDQHGI